VEKTDSHPFSCIDLGDFSWTNIDSLSAASVNSLAAVYPFHPLDLEDCLSKVQLPKIDEYQDYLFIILHFPRYLKEKRFSVPSQVSLFLSRDFLVTVHSGELKPINSLFESLRNKACQPDPDPSVQRRNCMADALGGQVKPSPVFLLYRVIYSLVENLHIMTGKVLSDIEDVEDRVFDEKVDAVREVTNLRHNIANFRRIAFPLKRVIHDLEKRIQRFTDEDMEIYFSDLTDYIDKVWHTLEECKETIEIYKDTDVVIGTDRTNRILAILTILFTFSIPLTLLGTLYGMNVNLPGGIERPWTFLGPYSTFFMIIIAASVPVTIMFFLFRKMRWL